MIKSAVWLSRFAPIEGLMFESRVGREQIFSETHKTGLRCHESVLQDLKQSSHLRLTGWICLILRPGICSLIFNIFIWAVNGHRPRLIFITPQSDLMIITAQELRAECA